MQVAQVVIASIGNTSDSFLEYLLGFHYCIYVIQTLHFMKLYREHKSFHPYTF